MRAKNTSLRRQNSTRKKLRGTKDNPRISVFRSNKFFSAQVIDDEKDVTLLSISEINIKELKGSKTEKSKALGLALAKSIKAKKISKAIFDRGRYAYHGRVRAFAESLREGGVKI
jgi:large subunit ribosomal protein L18